MLFASMASKAGGWCGDEDELAGPHRAGVLLLAEGTLPLITRYLTGKLMRRRWQALRDAVVDIECNVDQNLRRLSLEAFWHLCQSRQEQQVQRAPSAASCLSALGVGFLIWTISDMFSETGHRDRTPRPHAEIGRRDRMCENSLTVR